MINRISSSTSSSQSSSSSSSVSSSSSSLNVMARRRLSSQSMLVLLLLLNSGCDGLKPVQSTGGSTGGGNDVGSAALHESYNNTAAGSGHCVVVLEDSSEVLKDIGSVWVSTKDPCDVHACEVDEGGNPLETITKDDCDQFYCDVDSELRAMEGSCCGECVRSKCRFNDRVYDIGQTWHNDADCTLLECVHFSDGQPMINTYQKNCPPLPEDCPPERVYMANCCQYCNRSRTVGGDATKRLGESADGEEDQWTEEFYRNHACVRECKQNEPPMTCHYKFVVEWYETLSKACYDCPANATDCVRPHCIVGDGIPRSVTVVNRMMPGPSIEVCENDEIVVDVENNLLGESTTIHWHGMHQKTSPYMDGVPHISQCPISPHSIFRYRFVADNSGTHFWHSHTGMQRGDGVFGALIVRRPRNTDPHGHLYDFDLPEHKMIVQDWIHVPGVSIFASHHHSRGDNKPRNLLINGRGRYYKAIWEAAKQQARADLDRARSEAASEATVKKDNPPTEPSTEPATESVTEPVTMDVTTPKAAVDLLTTRTTPRPAGKRPKEENEISRLARLVRPDSNRNERPTRGPYTAPNATASTSPEADTVGDILARQKRATDNDGSAQIPLDVVPFQIYTVRRGFRYRFRAINAEFLNCPIVISVDGHNLTAINSDGYDFESVEVGSIVTYAGERFDFVLTADQPAGNYWVRLKGLMDCSEQFTSAFQVAILRYEGAPEAEPPGELGYQHKAEGIELNSLNRGPGHTDSLTVAELNAMGSYDSVPGVDRDALKPEADYKFFVYYDFYPKDNPEFHASDLYGFNANLSNENRLFTPQLNHISLKFPSVALLPARNEIDDSMFCNESSLAAQGIDCRREFCKCHHVLQVPLNSIVEFIIVDEGFTYDANHPFHLHGNAFRVVGLERLGSNVTIEMIKQLDRYNMLKRNLVRPPIKDTVTVPDGGYTIVRFEAYNPGFWLFHCHIEFHAEIGMALVLKVGDNNQMPPVPRNFPTCSNYMPDGKEETVGSAEATTASATTMIEPDRSAAAAPELRETLALAMISLLLLGYRVV